MASLFNIFKKNKDEGAEAAAPAEGDDGSAEEGKPAKPAESLASTVGADAASITKIATEIDRMKASIESFGEVRKSLNERMSHMSEQIGELRAMIMDRDRTIQQIELRSIKAADLVETVQPEKLMVEIQKQDAKFEALKANLEGNESIIDRVMEELKEVRKKVEFFRGIEEIIKLSEEIKKELIEVKKVEGTININTDKVQTIYAELRKRFQDIDYFRDSLQEIKVNVEQNLKDVDVMKVKMTDLAQKDDLDGVMKKMQRQLDSFKQINKASSMSKDLAQLKKLLEGV